MPTPPGNGLFIIERILRDRDGIWRQINEERDLKGLSVQMLVSSAISLAVYGIVLGASNSFPQALSSMVKLPLLFLATLAICLPTLYLFNLVFGARLSMAQAIALIMVSITVTSVLTLAFAPISLFFLITAQNYFFIKLLNVAILVLTAIVGLRFLTAGMASLNAYQVQRDRVAAVAAAPPLEVAEAAPALETAAVAEGNGAVATAVATAIPTKVLVAAPPRSPQSTSMTLLYIWILLFGFVGTQLAWTLRPFFGDPGHPFALFRHIDGTFYSDILHTISRLLHG
ncbi:MAG TPA: hypothetical protein VJT31_30425 [Rugosimonospora sp.]|nr:hypothetical protein [Rugosimonospora sp.]